MYRSNSYNENFSREMHDPKFAKQYLTELINESMNIEKSLRFVIKRMGTTDFALLVGEPKQTIDKFLKGKRNPKRETLDKFLRPFGLVTVVKVRPIKDEKVA